MPSHPLPGTFFQIGYVVPNLDAGLAHLNAKLGAPRFMVLREIVVENGWFRGGAATINHSMAFGYVGDVQFEVIEPVAGKSTYSEFLERVPAGGVHHLGFSVEDYDAATARLSAGPARHLRRHEVRLLREQRRSRHHDRDRLSRSQRAGHVRQHQGADVLSRVAGRTNCVRNAT
jgi:hypothetical protein